MARSNETFGKKEKEKKKLQKRKEKEAKKAARKENLEKGGMDSMMAYVDENGMITDTPPDPNQKKVEIDASSITIGVPKQEHVEGDDSPLEGRVSFFNDDKGYGFIKDKGSPESYFVHINNVAEPITEGDNVTFELERGPKGMVAIDVKKVEK